MNQIVIICFLILSNSSGIFPEDIYSNKSETALYAFSEQDTLKENQALYSGKVWKNMYRRINGDQFLFTDYFLDGTVTANGRTYKNLKIKYDIFSDEILIPVEFEEIVQLNKEMIDSFSITYENREYNFEKFTIDSLNKKNDYSDYFCVLYKGKTTLYLKYNKHISPNITDKSDGDFIEANKVLILKDKTLYPLASKHDLFTALNADKKLLKDYLRSNKVKITVKRPESLIPFIRFYDSTSK